MKLIVGLGNPGERYHHSRHNLGYKVVDELARTWSIEVRRLKFQGLFGQGTVGGQTVALLKPETYMNLSGGSVAEAVRFYKILPGELLVVVDDMDLEPGRMRLRASGSAGGHNGLKDIIARLGSDEFSRLRIGIGAAVGGGVGHVLGTFLPEEQSVIDEACERAVGAVECWLKAGIDQTMTRYNQRPAGPPGAEESKGGRMKTAAAPGGAKGEAAESSKEKED